MGHARSETFLKHYISSSVIVDVQATFLGQSSKSDLIKEMGKLTLRRDPNLPKQLTDAQKKEAHQVPALISAKSRWHLLGRQLKQEFGQINKAPQGCLVTTERQDLCRKIKTLKLRYEREAFEKLLNNFHSNADLEHMVAQLKGEKPLTTSMLAPVEHTLAQRTELAEILFSPANDSSFAQIVKTMAQLCKLHEEKSTRDSPIHKEVSVTEVKSSASPNIEPIICPVIHDQQASVAAIASRSYASVNNASSTPKPVIKFRAPPQRLAQHTKQPSMQTPAPIKQASKKSTCLFCNARFSRKDNLRRHYRTRHFQYQIGTFYCPVPGCEKLIKDPDHFSNHAVTCHKSDLGIRASVMRTSTRYAKPGQLATFNL